MLILSHRGFWTSPAEKNQAIAFRRSFESGFGTETDFRDFVGQVVIAHDPPMPGATPAADFFEVHRSIAPGVPLALNIKADGLANWMRELLDRFGVQDCFAFDMSVPDALWYLRAGIPTFTRQSEYEPEPAFYREAAGVWVDGFLGDWATAADIARHLDAGKRVCLVSPELHRRDHRAMWDRIAAFPFRSDPRLMICTDLPLEARSVFNG